MKSNKKVLERGMQKRQFIIMLKIDRGKKLLYDYDHSYKDYHKL